MSEMKSDGLKVVGTRPIRPDGVEKVTGRANFGADRALPGMLYGKIKRSPHAHALNRQDQRQGTAPGPGGGDGGRLPEITPEEAFVGEAR